MNRKKIFQILILALVLLVPAVLATDTGYRANPQHTGVYDATGGQPNNVLKWSYDELTNPITDPAVADGIVYFGSNDHNLYAIYAANGSEKWRFTTGKMILSAPAVSNGIVYFGSTDQHIYAVNAADGSLRWKVHTNSTWDSGIGTSAPAVVGGTVYIVSFDNNLYALNADTGAVRWKYPFQPSGGEQGSSPAVANGIVYFGDINRVFYAVNTADGTERWRYNGPGGRASSPPPVPVVSGGVLYTAGPGPHNITALNADTGAFRSVISRGYLTNWELISPAIANGVIYTGGADLNLYAINAASGADVWIFPLGACLRASPSVSDGIVYAPGMNKILYAIYAVNGTEKWRFSPPNNRGLGGTPVISGGVVYIDGDGADHLYAVGNQQAAPLIFTGQVLAGDTGNLSGRGLRDIPVRMYGSATASAPGALLGSTVTDSYGYYLLTAPSGSYSYINIIADDTIMGSTPNGAQTVGGTVKNASWIQFATPLSGKNLTGNNFWDYVPTVHGDFRATPLSGPAPLVVRFTDNSTGFPTNWNWVMDYNRTIDNGFIVCLSPNCSYTYTEPGLYSVQMRITNPVSHEWVTRLDYINVTAPAQQTGNISVVTTPSGAAISLDGVNLGHTTPYLLTGIGPGLHRINLTKQNYQNVSMHAQVAPGTTLRVNITLVPIAAPSITVTSPNGGETWQRGTTHTVTWSYTGSPGSNVKITLLKAGTAVGTINASTPVGSGGTGSYTWPITAGSSSVGSDYKVMVSSLTNPLYNDTSNNYFTLTAAGTTPTITVTSPNGGETWQRGTTHTVTWSYTGSPGSNVKITLLKAGTAIGTIIASTPVGSGGTGSYIWPITAGSSSVGSDYKVMVSSLTNPLYNDTSNNYFTLTAAGTTPTITVTSPNGGETWQRGTTHTVRWSYTGSPGSNVKITLLKAGTAIGTINASTPVGSGGTGSYIWPIYAGGAAGTDYTVKITSTTNALYNDTSNNYFTLTAASAAALSAAKPVSGSGDGYA